MPNNSYTEYLLLGTLSGEITVREYDDKSNGFSLHFESQNEFAFSKMTRESLQRLGLRLVCLMDNEPFEIRRIGKDETSILNNTLAIPSPPSEDDGN